MTVYARMSSFSDLFLMHSVRIAFASSTKKTMMYLEPLLDVVGKRPVGSVDVLFFTSIDCTKISFVRTFSVVISQVFLVGNRVVEGDILVERRFWLSCRRWPFVVAKYLER